MFGLTIRNGSADGGGGIFSRGDLTVNSSTVIGNSAVYFGSGIAVDLGTLILTNSTVSGNTTPFGAGGGISNAGTATLATSTVSGNTATYGGGVYNTGTVTMDRSTVSGNTANSGGGGIRSTGLGALTISNSTVSGNTAALGGGILADRGTLTLSDSTVSGNTAPFGAGGIFNGGVATMDRSTVSGNTANDSGGGIFSYGVLTINNSTVSGNTAGGSGSGGGIYNGGCTGVGCPNQVVNLANSTVTGNTAFIGGGVHNVGGSATATYTIIAKNSNADCSGSLTSAGHNLDSDGTCGLSAGGDLSNITNPQLGPLALNSPGSTETHVLCTGPGAPVPSCAAASPAIDAGGNDCPPPATDQRGVARPQGAACDIGAYEVVPPPPPTPTPTNTFTPTPTGGCVNPPPGLAGWWPLDETTGATVIADISGGGHNGIPHTTAVGSSDGPRPGASPQVVPPAEVDGSLYFYTQRTYIRVPHATKLEPGSGDFSIDTWVYPAQVGPGFVQPVVDKFDPGSNLGYALYIQSPSIANNARLTFVYGDGSLNLAIQSSSPIAYSQWHHVAVTVKRTSSPPPGGKYLEVQLYVDGAPKGNQQAVNPVGSIANSLELFVGGTRMSPLPGFGEIALDEVQMFDRALSPAEILNIFNAGGAGKCTPIPAVTFTPTPTRTGPTSCLINISKAPIDALAPAFTFNASWQAAPYTIYPGTTFSAQVPCDHTYSVTEKSTPGWTLTSIHCTVAGATGSFTTNVPTVSITLVHPGDKVSCIFTNSQVITPTATPTPRTDLRTPTATSTPRTDIRTPTVMPTPRKECGDVNDDGRVDSIDDLLVLQYIADLLHDVRNPPSADVNRDGRVDARDALLILQYIAGLDVRLLC
jgi:hypothetical protein